MMLFIFLNMFILKGPVKKIDTVLVSLIYQTHVIQGYFLFSSAQMLALRFIGLFIILVKFK